MAQRGSRGHRLFAGCMPSNLKTGICADEQAALTVSGCRSKDSGDNEQESLIARKKTDRKQICSAHDVECR
jgi:hypothetical protein